MDVGLQKYLTDAPCGAARRYVFLSNMARIRPRDRVSSIPILLRHSALRPQGEYSLPGQPMRSPKRWG